MTPEDRYDTLNEIAVLLQVAHRLVPDEPDMTDLHASLDEALDIVNPLVEAADQELTRESQRRPEPTH